MCGQSGAPLRSALLLHQRSNLQMCHVGKGRPACTYVPFQRWQRLALLQRVTWVLLGRGHECPNNLLRQLSTSVTSSSSLFPASSRTACEAVGTLSMPCPDDNARAATRNSVPQKQSPPPMISIATFVVGVCPVRKISPEDASRHRVCLACPQRADFRRGSSRLWAEGREHPGARTAALEEGKGARSV
jgi:hypothetical protein